MSDWLEIVLKSGATFSAGRGMIMDVDIDVEQDQVTGLPVIGARRLNGLLVEECAEFLRVFTDQKWNDSAKRVFGVTGACLSSTILSIGDALLPTEVRDTVAKAVSRGAENHQLHKVQILSSLTEKRRQTEINHETGAPDTGSLRDVRLVLRETVFYSTLKWLEVPTLDDKCLLAACVSTLRRAGLKRNRGCGLIKVRCLNSDMKDVTGEWLQPLVPYQGGAHD